MSRTRIAVALTLSLAALSAHPLYADVRADQKSQVKFEGMLGRMMNLFGGKGAKEGITTTVAVKGDRKATLGQDSGQIIDLAEEKVYDLDLKKKTYKVTTFADMRRQMEEAQKKAAENARKQQPQEKSATPEKNQKEMEIDFDVKNTGQTKAINSFDTSQVVVTITVREKGKTLEQGGGMVMTSDMWTTPKVAALAEVAAFDQRYLAKLNGPMMAGASPEDLAAAMAMYPMMKDAMGKMRTEGSKLAGTAILTTTTMDGVKSAEEAASQGKEAESDSPAPTSMGGMLGRFAKGVAKKKDDSGPPQARSTFMTTTHEVLKVTTDVSASDVAVPAGFQLK